MLTHGPQSVPDLPPSAPAPERLDMDASEAPTVLSLVPSARERASENVSEELAYLPRSRRTQSASGPSFVVSTSQTISRSTSK